MSQVSNVEPTVGDVAARIHRRRYVPAAVGLVIFAVVAAWTFLATPRYKSAALLRIDARTASSPLLDDLKSVPGASLMGLGRDELESEIGVLKSRRMADAVIDSLGLTVWMREPAGSRDSVLSVRTLGPADVEGRLVLTRRGEGVYDVAVTKFVGGNPPPAKLAAGDSAVVGAVRLRLSPLLRSAGPATITIDLLPHFKARKRLDDRTDIRMQEGGSRLVRVSYEDPDRFLAAAVVDRLVAEYVFYTTRNDLTDDRFRVSELGREVDLQAKRLVDAEERLRTFKERRRLVIPDEQATAQLKRISVLRTTLDGLEVERTALSRMLALIDGRAGAGREPGAYRQLATFPSLIANRAIQDYLMSLVELENKRSELSVRRTDQNDELRQFTTRITELEGQLRRVGSQYLESLEQQIAVATESVKTLSSDLDSFPTQEMEYVRLVRERTLLSEAFAGLLKQRKQLELQSAMRTDKVRVVDAPLVANAKDYAFPRIAVQLLLGAVLALAVALAIAFGDELLGGGIQASTTASQKAGSESAP